MRWLNLLFSGGFGYVQAGLLFGVVAWGGFHWVKYHDTMDDNAKLEAQAIEDRATIKSKDSTIKTLGSMAARREVLTEDGQDAQKTINGVPDSADCRNSEPMRVGVQWLRGYRDKRGEAADNDGINVQVPAEAETTKRDSAGQRIRRVLNRD